MNNRKSHNSILFLTTLGVYLGLVLVGATPHVLAQVGDLSKLSPAQKCELSAQIGNEGTNRFYKLGYKGGLNYLPTSIEYAFDDRDYTPFYQMDLLVTFSGAHPKYSLNLDTKRDFGEYAVTDEFGLSESIIKLGKAYAYRVGVDGKHGYVPVSVKVLSDESEFSVSLNFSESSAARATEFASAYTYFIEEGRCLYDNPEDLTKLLAENTKVSSSNEQIFIVTRLPRAGLNTLLAKSAK